MGEAREGREARERVVEWDPGGGWVETRGGRAGGAGAVQAGEEGRG